MADSIKTLRLMPKHTHKACQTCWQFDFQSFTINVKSVKKCKGLQFGVKKVYTFSENGGRKRFGLGRFVPGRWYRRAGA